MMFLNLDDTDNGSLAHSSVSKEIRNFWLWELATAAKLLAWPNKQKQLLGEAYSLDSEHVSFL